jgi:hypothetical protein
VLNPYTDNFSYKVSSESSKKNMLMKKKNKKYHFIYKTTNLINDKYYIGMHSTYNLDDGYMGSGLRIKKSLEKYGNENHKVEILEFSTNRETLKEREKEIISEDILKDKMCMNLQPGGGGGLCNKEHSKKFHQAGGKKVRQMLSKRHHEKMKNDVEYRERVISKIKESQKNMKNWWLDKHHTDETKRLISEAKKGRFTGDSNSQFGTQWITNGVENKKNKKNDEIPDGWKLGRIIKKQQRS